MNILIVSYHQIYPFKTGASIAQFGLIEQLSDRCNISLLIHRNFVPSDRELIELQKILPKVKIYTHKGIVKTKPIESPKYKINPVKKKIRQIQSWLEEIFSGKTKITPIKKYSPEQEFANLYSHNLFYLHPPKYVRQIAKIIEQDKINIVQLEFDINLSLVTLLTDSIKKIFIGHECKFFRIESHIEAKNLDSVYTDYIYNCTKEVEIGLLKKFDSIVVFNESEAKSLRQELSSHNHIKIHNIPFPILDKDFKEISSLQKYQLNKLVFVGPEKHFPNKDAVEWFLEEIAVDIRAKFGLKLYVVGEWSLETIEQYKNHKSEVTFTGYIEDLYEFSKDSISIAPVRIGGGLRTKILLAMAQGIPVISTTFALAGIEAKHLESVMIADDKKSFIGAVNYLLEDLNRTLEICRSAQNLVKNSYSQAVVSALRYELYQKLVEEIN